MFPTFDLLGKTIPTYALMSLIGIFVSGIYICKKAKQKGYDENNFIIIYLIYNNINTIKSLTFY